MKALVCGGRMFFDYERVRRVLDGMKITSVIEGGACGADGLAKRWATERDIECETFRAEWKKFGRGAGHIRSQLMLDQGKPDLVVAFPGGTGTDDMVARARKAGITVVEG
jgi:hypothetical protein